MGLLESSRPQRGYHVPHRQDASGELASLRREPGTVSAKPLTFADHYSRKDVSATFVPLRYDASTEASRVFNSCPTFLQISVMTTYCLFAFTACLRPNDCSLRPGSMEMGFRCSPSSGITSFHVETLDLCDLVSH